MGNKDEEKNGKKMRGKEKALVRYREEKQPPPFLPQRDFWGKPRVVKKKETVERADPPPTPR